MRTFLLPVACATAARAAAAGAGSHFESALTITSAQPEQQAALNATKIEIGLSAGALEFSQFMMTELKGGH